MVKTNKDSYISKKTQLLRGLNKKSWIGQPLGEKKFSKRTGEWHRNEYYGENITRWGIMKNKELTHEQKQVKLINDLETSDGYVQNIPLKDLLKFFQKKTRTTRSQAKKLMKNQK